MQPYYHNATHNLTIYHGDCLEVLPQLAPDSFGAVLADPPYNVGKDYGDHDDSQNADAYLAWLVRVLTACTRLSQDAVCYFPGRRHVWDSGQVLAQAGLKPVSMLGWHKREYAGDKWVGGPAMSWEPVVWASKQPSPRYNKRYGAWGRDFLVVNATHGDPRRKVHPCPKPLEVMVWLVGLFVPPGAAVLDPFLGSGTTLVAAKLAGRPGVGVEREERFCEMTAQELEKAELPFPLARVEADGQATFAGF